MHTHCGISYQSTARTVKPLGNHTYQWVIMDGTDQFHIPQAAFQLFSHCSRQLFGTKISNRFRFIAVYGNHRIGQIFFQRQQCNRTAVMETFVCRVLVG